MQPDQSVGIVAVAMIIFFFFLPTVVAMARRHRSAGAVFALNLLLGWTFIGWVVALIWALTSQRPVYLQVAPAAPPPAPRARKPQHDRIPARPAKARRV